VADGARTDVGGMLTEILPGDTYRVRLDDGSLVLAYAAGKTRKALMTAAIGDRVRVQVASDSAGRGRILG